MIVLSALATATAAAVGDSAPIVKVGVYKNGLALAERRVTPDADGSAVVPAAARPAYGTFWTSAEEPVRISRLPSQVELTFRGSPRLKGRPPDQSVWRNLCRQNTLLFLVDKFRLI